MTNMLEVEGIDVFYGPIQALRGVTMRVGEGEMVALLGANGAGKTTTLRAISGVVAPTQGSIRIGGKEAAGAPAQRVVRMGVAHLPEGRELFGELSVIENLRLGHWPLRKDKKDEHELLEEMFELFPRLKERAHQASATLSGGEQQMLAVARALMLGPRLLLLDEPSFGLAPLVVASIFEILRAINREEKVSILLVEQNAALALELADHAFLLETGRIVVSGEAATMRENETIRRSYLGY